jgi:hypothetical protein
MSKGPLCSPEMCARAVWMVYEHARDHLSQWATITSIASKIGGSALRRLGYAPNKQERATDVVLQQAEALPDVWSVAA